MIADPVSTPCALFLQVGHHQSLPVFSQYILTALQVEFETAVRLARLQQQMNLCIVPQRFKVAYPSAILPIVSLYTILPAPKVPRHQIGFESCFARFQSAPLHDLRLYLLQLLIPYNMKLRLLFFQLPQFGQHRSRIAALRKDHLI